MQSGVVYSLNNDTTTSFSLRLTPIFYRAERRLGLVRKAASTTSDCAYFEANLFKRQQYWHAQFPDGLQGESTRDIIDRDESNYKLETQNRKFGKVTRKKRCDARGKYKKGELHDRAL